MMEILRKIFSSGPAADFRELVRNGAVIVDVRTKDEFRSGNIPGSVNIPLQHLHQQLGQLKKDKVVITCCASGMRSASAKSILSSHGFREVYNGGGWISLNYKIQ